MYLFSEKPNQQSSKTVDSLIVEPIYLYPFKVSNIWFFTVDSGQGYV